MMSTKMSLVRGALTLCICFAGLGENSAEETTVDSIRNSTNETITVTKNYLYDPQILGFNSTDLTSGPIVLADKRTLFITDLQYKGSEEVLVFYVGTGSPYNGTKHLIAEEYFVANHTNLYVSLWENLTLDTIEFVAASLKNSLELLDYTILGQVDRSTIRSYQREKYEETIYRVPKCCRHDEYLTTTAKGCVRAETDIVLNINIFESNETGLDPDIYLNSSDYDLRPYIQELKCNDNELGVDVADDLHGLIYNSSLIIQGNGILAHGEYCVEMIVDENHQHATATFICYPIPVEVSDPNLYLPMLILSAICFAISSTAYGIILKAKDIHKICFIIFSTSMCLTFLSLIILQVQSGDEVACNIFGFIFLFSTVLSFLWLLILCLELLYVVRIPIEEKRNDRRWYWYVAVSCGISTLLCLISLFSGDLWVPDVPDSFIKTYGTDKCIFETSFDRTFIIFAPMILSIVLSCTSLGVMRQFINKNEKSKNIKNHVDWVVNKNAYKFLARTYVIIIIVASFWLLNIFYFSYQLGNGKTQLALVIIEASLGVVTLIGFVLNKYTLAEIKDKLCKKKQRITEEGLRLNGIPTPETPATDLDLDDPFFQPQNRNSRMTTFGGNDR